MKNIGAVLLFIASFNTLHAQEAKPHMLNEPVTWAFEKFTLPPVFAPGFPYKGVEELRFAPGMFIKDSTDYFTYAFVAQLDSTDSFSQQNIEDYLGNYFKGLCGSTAKDRHLVVDTSKITVLVEKKRGTATNEVTYNALLHIFGVFADGAPVKLNMEIKVLFNLPAKRTYLVFIASPQQKNHAVWKILYAIQKHFTMPG